MREFRPWEEVEKELFTPEEIAESDARAEILIALDTVLKGLAPLGKTLKDVPFDEDLSYHQSNM